MSVHQFLLISNSLIKVRSSSIASLELQTSYPIFYLFCRDFYRHQPIEVFKIAFHREMTNPGSCEWLIIRQFLRKTLISNHLKLSLRNVSQSRMYSYFKFECNWRLFVMSINPFFNSKWTAFGFWCSSTINIRCSIEKCDHHLKIPIFQTI